MNKQDIRALYKSAKLLQTHIAYTTAIATAAICKYRFRLRYVLGAGVTEEGLSAIGLAVHEVLSLGMPGPILDVWKNNTGRKLAPNQLLELLDPIKQKVLDYHRKWYQSRDLRFPPNFEVDLNHTLLDLLASFVNGIMTKQAPPRRVLTEIVVTNVEKQHEGRLDALLENDDGTYLIIDWKTSPEPAHSHGYNHMQALGNALLANYRYHGEEDDFTGCQVAVVHCDGVFRPRIPPTPAAIERIKEARGYVLECLTGRAPRAQMPYWAQCMACPDQRNCEFYRHDTMLDREGVLPEHYSAIRKSLFRRRTVVLEERANIHVDKFVIDYVLRQAGEHGLIALEETGIVESGYRLKDVKNELLILQRSDGTRVFEKRNIVRAIGIEPNIPLFACINTKGDIHELNSSSVVIRVRSSVAASRAFEQLKDLPILLVRDNIDLTARELESLHFFNVFAARKMIPR